LIEKNVVIVIPPRSSWACRRIS